MDFGRPNFETTHHGAVQRRRAHSDDHSVDRYITVARSLATAPMVRLTFRHSDQPDVLAHRRRLRDITHARVPVAVEHRLCTAAPTYLLAMRSRRHFSRCVPNRSKASSAASRHQSDSNPLVAVGLSSTKQQQTRTLAALRDTLLPKLISGELRVKDAVGAKHSPSGTPKSGLGLHPRMLRPYKRQI